MSIETPQVSNETKIASVLGFVAAVESVFATIKATDAWTMLAGDPFIVRAGLAAGFIACAVMGIAEFVAYARFGMEEINRLDPQAGSTIRRTGPSETLPPSA